MIRKIAVIVAGGSGTRTGAAQPKQFVLLGGRPMLVYSMQQYQKTGAEIIVVLPESHISTWQKMVQKQQVDIPHKIVAGGAERFHSVKNALNNIAETDAVVAIHDAARPFVSFQLIESIFRQAHICGGAIPLLPIAESIRKKDNENTCSPVDRKQYFSVQTPQAFRLNLLKKAYLQEYDPLFTDDATVFEAAGNKVEFIAGETHNFKITTPQDLQYAQYLVENKHVSIK